MASTNPFVILRVPAAVMGLFMGGLAVWRLLFSVTHGISDGIRPWVEGFRLDLSLACGAYLILFIPIILYQRYPVTYLRWVVAGLLVGLWLFVCGVEWVSLLMYRQWGSTLDARAVSYLAYPAEAWASSKAFVGGWQTLILLLFGLGGAIYIVWCIRRWAINAAGNTAFVLLLLSGPLAFLGLRGGWQKLPIVPSDAFYSTRTDLNFLATNKVWYLLYTLTRSLDTPRFYTDEALATYLSGLTSPKGGDNTGLTLDWRYKNIVILILEGWSASLMADTSSRSVTPFVDSLSQQSLRFTQAYSSGFRTDQGLLAILSGTPSIQSINMPNALHKVSHYPSLSRLLKRSGRYTSFCYGGDLNFANLAQYLSVQGFDTIVSRRTLPGNLPSSEWGIHDMPMLKEASALLSTHPEPFFSSILLQSSHAPFDVPTPYKAPQGSSVAQQYTASVAYSDAALRSFFTEVKKTPWYQNSMFIIVADHGTTHLGAAPDAADRFHIPMVVCSPDPEWPYRSTTHDTPCNHFDLPATIAAAAGCPGTDFPFSRNLAVPDKERCAYWNTDQVACCRCGSGTDESVALNAPPAGHVSEPLMFLDAVKWWFTRLDATIEKKYPQR